MKQVINLSLRLTVVCAVASAGLAGIYSFTAERIKDNQKAELRDKLKTVLPGADRFETENNKFTGYAGEKKVGTAVKLSPKGYSGEINFLLGISIDKKILGIAVLSHKETPGLGKKIETEAFKTQFIGKIQEELYLKKDSSEGEIDGITAATISSRAVTKAVQNELEKMAVKGEDH